MPVCSLAVPDPDRPRTRYVLAVKYGGYKTYAVYRNGSYEFEVNDNLYDRLRLGTMRATFEMDHGHPLAILLSEHRGGIT